MWRNPRYKLPDEQAEPAAQSLVIYTATELAALLKISKSAVYERAATREWPCLHLGRSVRFTDKHLAEILAQAEQASCPADGLERFYSAAELRRSVRKAH